MISQILDNVSFITFFAIVTFLVAMVFLKKSYINRLLLVILFVNAVTEITSLGFIIYDIKLNPLYNCYFIIHQCLWLYLIVYILKQHQNEYLLPILFVVFGLINLLFIEKSNLKYYTFIIGGLCYLIYFLVKSILLLKQEDLTLFRSNTYILLSIPLVFFIGLIIIFGFRNSGIRAIKIGHMKLYSIISLMANTIFYTLVNIYTFKSRTQNE